MTYKRKTGLLGEARSLLQKTEMLHNVPDPSVIRKNTEKFLKTFQKPIDKTKRICYNVQVVKIRPIGQAVKTLASHAGNSGSIPGWVTKRNKSELFRKSKLVRICFLLLNFHIDAVSERGHATSLFSFFSASCCAFHSANSLCPCSDSK